MFSQCRLYVACCQCKLAASRLHAITDDSEGLHAALWQHMWSQALQQAQPLLTQATGGAVTGSSTAQGAGSSPFHEAAAQNGFQSGFQPSQQGPALTSQPSLVSQTSTFQQSTGQPPFLVQYGSSVQGQYFLLPDSCCCLSKVCVACTSPQPFVGFIQVKFAGGGERCGPLYSAMVLHPCPVSCFL